ncbi:hypothetical protein Vau01_097170 [Virgisporangium aurantiacum]|uniref:NmrA-like family protein n=1 Tax=Virgisporangium aurantiacum TaxID=175570 RepID=A0A8J4E5E4_9ACTN|nr:hypothetical protein Vau01_097170 [Virgisporangium aurantiacum]
MRVPFPTARAATIDPYDIAAVAVQVLLGGHDGQIHELTGPEFLLPADQVSVLAKVLGRNLHCHGMTDAETREEMDRTMPTEYVDAFFNFYGDGVLDESHVHPTVRNITRHEPRTFEQWTRAHGHEFQGPTANVRTPS